jgi:phage shock protein PspC (stress-responsive transcriptional regulator)
LVRPRHGRLVAGVCAGIGRATNTDPLLWRVLIGVLAIFGIGIALYAGAWLLTPAEGDTASPIESLIGRGHSSTSAALTIGLVVFTIVCIGALTDNWIVPVVAIVAVTVVILANPRARHWNAAPARVPGPEPQTEPIAVTPPVAATGYQPPFAPHGPYAPAPPPVPPIPAKPPKVKRERSRLGRLVMGLILLAMGVLGLADLAGASVPMTAYAAVALLIIGLGLLLGTWLGRARGLILIGVVLSVALPILADEDFRDRSTPSVSPIYWVPTSVDEVSEVYDNRFGDATLDLSNVDFTGQKKIVRVEVGVGSLRVILPERVDVVVHTTVRLGNADVLGHSLNGANVENSQRDLGTDGEGGGNLELQLTVRAGNAQVTR